MISSREAALLVLNDWEKEHAYLNIAYQNRLKQAGLSREEAAFAKELAYGVVTYKLALDAQIRSLSSIRMKKIAVPILNILRLGFYQMRYLDKIPESAAVNESVKLAKKYGHASSAGFVNALLRAYLRGEKHLTPDSLTLRYSYPEWLVEKWLAEFGPEDTKALLAAGNERPPLFIRCNSLKTDRDALAAALSSEGFSTEPSAISPLGLLLRGGNPEGSAAYKNGLFTIQDEASQLPALILAPEPGDTVLDMCAAPGGKTTQLGELMENKGQILAFDLYPERAQMVERSAKRLGVSIIRAAGGDAAKPAERLTAMADRVLLDVPCSGLGIIRRKPDIKYNITPDGIREIIQTQEAILQNCARYVKPGGVLVYSTCSINPEENEQVTNRFLAGHPEFSLSPFPGCETGRPTLYPHRDGCDGFFICRMKRS